MDPWAIEEAPPGFWRRFWVRLHEPYPDPDSHRGLMKRLNPRSGEFVQLAVPKHLVVYYPVPLAFIAMLAMLVLVAFRPNVLTQFLFLVSVGTVVVAVVRAYIEWRDVLILTNWRVVRSSGLFTTRVATMPINRILDMTMTRPFLGRILGYGHFVFESAAQEQGLREIKFVPNILEVDHRINDAVNAESKRRERLASPGAAGKRVDTEPVPDVPAPAVGGRASDGETTDPLRGL